MEAIISSSESLALFSEGKIHRIKRSFRHASMSRTSRLTLVIIIGARSDINVILISINIIALNTTI